jgi:uncharacterized membrane protein
LRWVDKLADAFGSLPFIVIFNVGTLIWSVEGRFNPHWFDPWPYNLSTYLMSWLAINMTSFVLWSDRRRRAREQEDDERQRKMLEAILRLAISTEQTVRMLLKNKHEEGRKQP